MSSFEGSERLARKTIAPMIVALQGSCNWTDCSVEKADVLLVSRK
jgi:hypothetical protein